MAARGESVGVCPGRGLPDGSEPRPQAREALAEGGVVVHVERERLARRVDEESAGEGQELVGRREGRHGLGREAEDVLGSR